MSAPVVIPRGGSAAVQRQADEKAARKSRSFADWEYLSLEAPADGEIYGESVVIRWVTDEADLRETRQHSFANTKPAPADKPKDKKWPVKMGSVCRQSPGFDAIYDDCYICESPEHMKEDKNGKLRPAYAGLRLWGVAVIREPIIGTQEMADKGEIQPYEVGSPVGYQDATFEKDEYVDGEATGKKITVKKFVVANFGLDNFFNAVLGFYNAYGTLLDRDYKITRKGKGTETSYEFAPQDKILVDGKVFDLRNPLFAEDYAIPFNLDEIIANLASDEYYDWFFNKNVESSWVARFGEAKEEGGESKGESNAAQEEQTRNTIDAMRERFRNK